MSFECVKKTCQQKQLPSLYQHHGAPLQKKIFQAIVSIALLLLFWSFSINVKMKEEIRISNLSHDTSVILDIEQLFAQRRVYHRLHYLVFFVFRHVLISCLNANNCIFCHLALPLPGWAGILLQCYKGRKKLSQCWKTSPVRSRISYQISLSSKHSTIWEDLKQYLALHEHCLEARYLLSPL